MDPKDQKAQKALLRGEDRNRGTDFSPARERFALHPPYFVSSNVSSKGGKGAKLSSTATRPRGNSTGDIGYMQQSHVSILRHIIFPSGTVVGNMKVQGL